MEWLETSPQQADAVADWARERRLAYARLGSLAPASLLLQRDGDDEGVGRISTNGRPGRWTENVCDGELPGGVAGQIGHHTYLYYSSESWREEHATVTVATLLEGTRIARGFYGETHPPRELNLARREFGDDERVVGTRDGRFTWTIPTETDDALFQELFDARVVAAMARLPRDDRLTVSQREGSLSIALLDRHTTDAAELDALCEATAALAASTRRVAQSQRQLAPGDVLPEPRATPYRQWARTGAANIDWPRPPATLDEAVTAYGHVAASDPAVARRRRRGRAVMLGLFGLIALFGAAVSGAAGGLALGIVAFVIVFGLGVALALLVGRSLAGSESSFRTEAWGLEAFAAGYAASRGFYLEDPQELCRRFTMPLFGSPQRAMRGELAPGVPGRIVLWRDRNDPTPLPYVNVALVPGTLAPGAAPERLFGAVQAGPWIVVYEKSSRQVRSIQRLDALAAEAVRLACAATTPA
jgi:hypothetical protein